MVLLYFYEGHYAKNPVIHTRIFKNRNAAIAYISVILHGTVVTGSLYYLPLYYEAVKGLSPILSGVALLPETFTIAPGAFIVGALIARTNSYRWAIWAGWAITCLGLGVLWLLDVGTSTPQWIFMNLVVGIGVGFNYVALGVMLQASVRDEDMTSAVAMWPTPRSSPGRRGRRYDLRKCAPYGPQRRPFPAKRRSGIRQQWRRPRPTHIQNPRIRPERHPRQHLRQSPQERLACLRLPCRRRPLLLLLRQSRQPRP